jgi:ubiquinone/menaquinone biosynthesis C-methylase UbiE
MASMDKAEFDSFADEYYSMHTQSIKLSGERPDFFSEYKIADAANAVSRRKINVRRILDFGSGIGNSVPWFRKYFPVSELICADVSLKSMAVARQRYPGPESYVEIAGETLPVPDQSFDLAFTACVFHHIPPAEHIHWFTELRRVTRPGGLFVVFEHNPWNPLTVHVVNTCAFDVNAKLISAPLLRSNLKAAKWQIDDCRYRIFFPRALAALRPLEKLLKGLPLGAQYFVVGRNAPQ